jgi:hypothetical protein
MKDRGIIFLAAEQERFVCEAVLAAKSAKEKIPKIPVALFTDLEVVLGARLEPFDEIIRIEHSPAHGSCGNLPMTNGRRLTWGGSMLSKVRILARSPYRRTLYLDTDTRILSSETAAVFDFLEKYSVAIAACTPETSDTCRILGQPIFNCGVIAYRKGPDTLALFRKWEELTSIYLDLARRQPAGDLPFFPPLDDETRRFMLANDQTALAAFLTHL